MPEQFKLRSNIESQLWEAASILNLCLDKLSSNPFNPHDDVEAAIYSVKKLLEKTSTDFDELQKMATYETRINFAEIFEDPTYDFSNSDVVISSSSGQDEVNLSSIPREAGKPEKKKTNRGAGRGTLVKGKKK